MKLWIAERADRAGYDEYYGLVIRAETIEQAVKLAHIYFGKWACRELLVEGSSEVVFEAFNAG